MGLFWDLTGNKQRQPRQPWATYSWLGIVHVVTLWPQGNVFSSSWGHPKMIHDRKDMWSSSLRKSWKINLLLEKIYKSWGKGTTMCYLSAGKAQKDWNLLSDCWNKSFTCQWKGAGCLSQNGQASMEYHLHVYRCMKWLYYWSASKSDSCCPQRFPQQLMDMGSSGPCSRLAGVQNG